MNDRTRMLQAYLDGELDAEQRRMIQARLDADPEWRQELDELRQVWSAVDTLVAPALDTSLWTGVEAGLRARKRQRMVPWTMTQKFAAAAAMVAGLVVGFGVGSQPASSIAVTDVASGSVSMASEYQDELLTLDAMWLQLGSTDEDSES